MMLYKWHYLLTYTRAACISHLVISHLVLFSTKVSLKIWIFYHGPSVHLFMAKRFKRFKQCNMPYWAEWRWRSSRLGSFRTVQHSRSERTASWRRRQWTDVKGLWRHCETSWYCTPLWWMLQCCRHQQHNIQCLIVSIIVTIWISIPIPTMTFIIII